MPALLGELPVVTTARITRAIPQEVTAEFEALLIRAARSVCAPHGIVTAAQAMRALETRRVQLKREMVGATSRWPDNPSDAIKERIREQRKRRSSFKPVKRLQSGRLRPCPSNAHDLQVRMRAIARIAREIKQPSEAPGLPGFPRTMVDLKLDAIILERDGSFPHPVFTAELAYVYDLPEHLITEWPNEHPPELDGLYDDDDHSTPAAHRHMDERDHPGAYREAGGRPYYRSGLRDGRPTAPRDCARVIGEMSGYTVERARELVAAGMPRATRRAPRPEETDHYHLNRFLADIVKRKEATVVGLAETLGCSRSTMQRRLDDGDWQPGPIPLEPPITSWVKPEPSIFDHWSYAEP